MPWIVRTLIGFVFKGVERGAQGPVMLAADAGLADASGRYWLETEEKQPSDDARDPALAKRLWDESAKACGLAA